MQYDEASWHVPLLQYCEQQSSLPPQVFPAVLQVVLRVAHLPALHFPLQQSLSAPQACWSEMHAVCPHRPFAPQCRLQQSVPWMHLLPTSAQAPTPPAHRWVVASHKPVQHWSPVVHEMPEARHSVPPSPPPPPNEPSSFEPPSAAPPSPSTVASSLPQAKTTVPRRMVAAASTLYGIHRPIDIGIPLRVEM